jgi:hypothetical protein
MAYLGASPPSVFSAPTKDVFSGDGSETVFTLSKSAGSAATIDVFVANARQEPDVAYTTSDRTLTFTSAPASGTNNIYVINNSTVIGNGLLPVPGRDSDSVTNFTSSGIITAAAITASSTATISGALTTSSTATIGGDTKISGNLRSDSSADGIKINATDGSASNAGDLILLDGTDASATNAGSSLLYEDETGDPSAYFEGNNINFSAVPTITDGALKSAGRETIWVPANAMYGNSTNGAEAGQTELGNGPELKTLDFDKDSDEFAQFAISFPKSWNKGTVTFQAYFTGNSTNTGNVAFKLAGVGLADGELTNIAFGTAVQAEAKSHSGVAYNLNITRESGAITIAGVPSAEEYVFFEISRDVSADNFSADALLLGIKLFFTTNAGNDA